MRPLDRHEKKESYLDIRRNLPQITACNMSRDGLCMMSHEPLNPGDLIKLDLRSSDNPQPIPCVAEVCWSSGGRSGLRILAVTEAGRSVLQKNLRTATFSVKSFGTVPPAED
jgi:hypothetical protein